MLKQLTMTVLTIIPMTMTSLFAHAVDVDDEGEEIQMFNDQPIDQDQSDEELQAAEDEAQIQFVQWGGGRGKTWTCRARSRDGRTFVGRSRNINSARRMAMSRCGSRSRSCFMSSCR